MSDEQKTDFKAALILGSYQSAADKIRTFLYKDLQPYQVDPKQAEIRLEHGNALMIGSTVNNVSTQEGAAIEGLQPKTPSLPTPRSPLPNQDH